MLGQRMMSDLDRMHGDVIRLAGLVEAAVAETVLAVLHRDLTRATRVIDGEAAIDDLENRIGDECHRILALYQPVAVDLRQVLTVFQMTADLERVGDHALEIAERTRTLARMPPFLTPEGLPRMAELAAGMVRRAVNAYACRDATAARKVCGSSAEVDALCESLSAQLVTAMKADSAAVDPALAILFAVRSLQRIAEHATNLAEEAVFLIEGQTIRHHWGAAGSATPPRNESGS